LQRQKQRRPAAERSAHQIKLLEAKRLRRFRHRRRQFGHVSRPLVLFRAKAWHFERYDAELASQQIMALVQP
jgi:hypothetical protein